MLSLSNYITVADACVVGSTGSAAAAHACYNMVWGLGFGVWSLGFGVWVLGFGDWGLGFGVWGLGSGVWGLGFGGGSPII